MWVRLPGASASQAAETLSTIQLNRAFFAWRAVRGRAVWLVRLVASGSKVAWHRTWHAAALILLVTAPASAQPTTAQLVKLIEVQQKQIDQLQARLDGQETFARVTIDYLTTWSGLLMVQGWGFACGQADGGRLVVVVDGVQTGQATAQQFFRWPRYDVWNDANGALCRQVFAYVPTVNAGFQTLVDMTPYEPLEGKDRTHTVSVRIYDRYGRMRESETTAISYDAATKAYKIVPLRQE